MSSLFALLLSLLAAPCCAQPADTIDALRRAYRDEPIAERVTIAHTVARRTVFDELIVRVFRTPEQRHARIELPTLTISARGDASRTRIVAVHPANDAVALVREFDEPLSWRLLARVFPPIPAPQLALAFDETGPLPPSRVDRFEEEAGAVRLTGRHAGERASLVPAPTGRLASMRVKSDAFDLRLRIEPVEPGDPQQWGIDTDGRRIVTDPRALRPAPAPFPVAEEFPIAEFQDARFALWPIDLALAPDESLRRVEERYLVLVFFRLPDALPERSRVLTRVDAAIDAAQGAADDLARRSRTDGGLGPRRALVRTLVRPVACLEVPQARRAAIHELARRWRLDTGGSALLWTLSPAGTIDRLAFGAEVAIAIIDEQRRLVRVLVPNDDDSLADRVREAIEREVNLVPSP